jgi:catechol 2,3-dioxygenase-like lactoylglutathione lyase family enzyme
LEACPVFDHLSLGVRDLVAARRFYDALFAPLGHANAWAREAELAYGPGGESGQFFLYPVAGATVAGLGTHIAFSAESREALHAAYEAALTHGATTLRAAGPHPDIAPDYYGAIILDPDGNRLEIVSATMH